MSDDYRQQIGKERLGTMDDGDYVVLTVSLDTQHVGAERTTMDHTKILSPLGLSFVGEVWAKGRSPRQNGGEAWMYGQVTEQMREITTPAPGWTLDEIRELADLADEWHLNTMNAGCNHMDLPEDTDYDARKHLVCLPTGYRYGSAWLVKPLPDAVLERVRHLMRDRSEDLYRERGYDAHGKAFPDTV